MGISSGVWAKTLASVQCVTRFWEMYLCLLSDVRIFISFSIFFLFPLQMCKYLCNSERSEALWSIIVSLHIELVWNQFLVCGHWPGNKLIRRFQLIGYVMKILGRAWRLENKKWSSYSLQKHVCIWVWAIAVALFWSVWEVSRLGNMHSYVWERGKLLGKGWKHAACVSNLWISISCYNKIIYGNPC